ncbi:MAG: hypothetical protein ACK44A_05390 [Roseateles sp.]
MPEPHPPDNIAGHPDRCGCNRCAGLEACPFCCRVKLDADYCYSCRRLVFLEGRFRTRVEAQGCGQPDPFSRAVE